MEWFENFDIESIFTPVNADKFEELLLETGYDSELTRTIINGFREGFLLGYAGNRKVVKKAPNLKLRIGSKHEIWSKVMAEIKAKRYAGPFEQVPYEYYIQSPIGLVPKDGGRKTRLIFHLSYPRTRDSVNSGIPEEICKVKYPDFDEAIKLCLREGVNCKLSKSDMSMAFRHVPLKVQDFSLLILKAEHPLTGKTYFFIKKCLPFGSSISCAHFQSISNAIAHIVKVKTGKTNVNYLDDYLFASLWKSSCDMQIRTFLQVCKEICFPVAMEKTVLSTSIIVFLGLLINTGAQVVCIPLEKVKRALDMIEFFVNRNNKKATVLKIQKLCGFLNFLCRAVVPGRTFTARLYSLIAKKTGLKQHHHVRITDEARKDLMVWKQFLQHPEVYCRPFLHFTEGISDADEICMYSDASRNFDLGFGALCGTSWMYGKWNKEFFERVQPSIEFLELYGVMAGILKWLYRFRNRSIRLFCDNQSVCMMINNKSSKCKYCMKLIRLVMLHSMINNVRVFAKYVRSEANGLTDSLSRLDFNRFKRLGQHMEVSLTAIPDEIWPVQKIWEV